MERAKPRKGSLCLPTGYEKLRLVLVPLALFAGLCVGAGFFLGFEHAGEAVAVGVATADIALHIVELVIHSLVLSRWALILALELGIGAAGGMSFFLVFDEVGEAIAVGVMAANIALHVAELAVDWLLRDPAGKPTAKPYGPGKRFRTYVGGQVRRIAEWLRRFGGFGGTSGSASSAGAF